MSIQSAIFSNRQGSGYISDSFSEMNALVSTHLEPIILGNTELKVGGAYDLDSFFNRLLPYLGYLDKENRSQEIFIKGNGAKELIFYIGSDQSKHYFQSVFWITPIRFYLHYSHNTGRDYNFKPDRTWCFQKKSRKSKKK